MITINDDWTPQMNRFAASMALTAMKEGDLSFEEFIIVCRYSYEAAIETFKELGADEELAKVTAPDLCKNIRQWVQDNKSDNQRELEQELKDAVNDGDFASSSELADGIMDALKKTNSKPKDDDGGLIW